MINAEKIVFEKQNYYTPSWSGVTTVKILEVLPKGKVRVKAGESIFVRSMHSMSCEEICDIEGRSKISTIYKHIRKLEGLGLVTKGAKIERAYGYILTDKAIGMIPKSDNARED